MITLIENNSQLFVSVNNTSHHCDINWENSNNKEIVIDTFFDAYTFDVRDVIVSYKFKKMTVVAVMVNNIVIEIPIYYQLKRCIRTNEYTNKLTKYINEYTIILSSKNNSN
jgi:hypothetical protein